MNIHLGAILAISLILIGSCVSFDVLDRALRGTSKHRLDVCNSQLGTYFHIVYLDER